MSMTSTEATPKLFRSEFGRKTKKLKFLPIHVNLSKSKMPSKLA
jgi:hypothetical protein